MLLTELCARCFLPLPKRFVLMLGSSGLVRTHDRLACRHGRYSGKGGTKNRHAGIQAEKDTYGTSTGTGPKRGAMAEVNVAASNP